MEIIAELLLWLIWQILSFIAQIIANVLLEALFYGTSRAVSKVTASQAGRVLVDGLGGLVFGLAWGDHLSGNEHWPKLLWASLAMAAAAGVLVIARATDRRWAQPPPPDQGWREIIVPPWRWSSVHLAGFLALNLTIAIGIVITFPGWA